MSQYNSSNNLAALGYDVLHLILLHLCGDSGRSTDWRDVLAVSVVSKSLRNYALPVIFRDVCWPKKGTPEFYPPELWVHIRRLTLVEARWATGHNHELALLILSQILSQLPSLVTFVYPMRVPPSLAFLTCLAENPLPSIQTLEVSTSFLLRNFVHRFNEISGIRKLVIKQPDNTSLHAAPEYIQRQSMNCVTNMVMGCRETLFELDVPGEHFSLAAFACSESNFPCLKKLVLRGYPPVDWDQYPIWQVLRCMPKISSVEVCCRLRMIGISPQRYVLMPRDASPPPGEPNLFPSLLETLVICNPSLTDNILRRLPHSLKCLVLDFVPYWDRVMASGDLLAYHALEKMTQTFRAMRHAMGSVPNLEHLRINMGWCISPELLKCICDLFPGLRILELQGIRYFNRGGEPESDLSAFVNTLSQLHFLETLKLAVELKEDPYRDGGYRKIGSVDESSQTWANTLAASIPRLKSIAFEARAHTGKTIGSRSLVGEPLWLWYFLDKKGDTNLMRRSGEPVDWDLLDKSFRW
ncbi:hypothetical protein VNI00_002807 [Paramarasmius palmivorus]|uniref:F-box domain-containing protein n=1 Tax=Paramarasmius palmivorus TaxID=297713 RepID=A0AAW0E0M2_9AGAR